MSKYLYNMNWTEDLLMLHNITESTDMSKYLFFKLFLPDFGGIHNRFYYVNID